MILLKMVGGYMGGGYGGGGDFGGMDMGMGMAEPGLLDKMRGMLSMFPEWMANLIIALIFLGAAALVGWIFGKIIGSILYPDPEKQSFLTKKQKFAVLGVVLVTFAVAIFALQPHEPKMDDMMGQELPGEMMGEELPMEGEIPPEGEVPAEGEAPAEGELPAEGEDAPAEAPEGEAAPAEDVKVNPSVG